MGHTPALGWNISPTYGPIYLLQELYSGALKAKGDLNNDGHYFVTSKQVCVAYTRCWNWQKGFKGDPRANESATTMLQGLPQAVSEALDARRVAQDEQMEGVLPTRRIICDDVQAGIANNTFEEIMEAVRNERNYVGITAEDVMRCIPRGLCLHPGKPGWLTCRHCRTQRGLKEFPNDIGVLHHFKRGAACTSQPPPRGSASPQPVPAPPSYGQLKLECSFWPWHASPSPWQVSTTTGASGTLNNLGLETPIPCKLKFWPPPPPHLRPALASPVHSPASPPGPPPNFPATFRFNAFSKHTSTSSESSPRPR